MTNVELNAEIQKSCNTLRSLSAQLKQRRQRRYAMRCQASAIQVRLVELKQLLKVTRGLEMSKVRREQNSLALTYGSITRSLNSLRYVIADLCQGVHLEQQKVRALMAQQVGE